MAPGVQFPDDYYREFIARNLIPGSVIKLARRMDDGHVKEKRYVILDVKDDVTTFVVNTKPSQFLMRRSGLLRGQILMEVATHSFMDHDSYVDCTQMKRYSTRDVIDELSENQSWLLGTIDQSLRVQIGTALSVSSTIPPALAAKMRTSLLGAQ